MFTIKIKTKQHRLVFDRLILGPLPHDHALHLCSNRQTLPCLRCSLLVPQIAPLSFLLHPLMQHLSTPLRLPLLS